ncbi:unnamed protein product [Lepeophtheirus salmonis]|uniref:(salmon louse) hypothetical protein n=1 Tax=Lepeophtheirus salmonis TaxID=72036 RepID=A0A7R8CZT6_LEPSM|nr:unnamed protein product [Lepeophtheirus salmonis]CAF2953356.1 unnamed protein product [Lepeophtheirus salmonis]
MIQKSVLSSKTSSALSTNDLRNTSYMRNSSFLQQQIQNNSSREKAKDPLYHRIKNIMKERVLGASHHNAYSKHALTDREEMPKIRRGNFGNTFLFGRGR